MDAFSFILDSAQDRLASDRIAALVSGLYEPDKRLREPIEGWHPRWGTQDGNGDLTTWVDPITAKLMLRPAPLSRYWDTLNTGIYARLMKSGFTFNDATKWEEQDKSGAAFVHFMCLTDEAEVTANRSAVSTTTWPKNRPFFLRWWSENWGDEKSIQIDCGWNTTASNAAGVSLRFWGSGKVEVWKDGYLVGEGSLLNKDDKQEKQQAKQFVSVMLIPIPQRELLIVSNQGGGFSHTFVDIDEGAVDPIITTASPFWFYFPAGKAELEIAPIRFPTLGYRASVVQVLSRPPGAGQVPVHTAFWSLPGYGTQSISAQSLVQENDATTVWTPSGRDRKCRIRVDLEGDGESTPYLSGSLAEFEGEISSTDDSESVVLDQYILSAKMEVPEDPGGFRLSLVLNSPEEIDPGFANKLDSLSNRPLTVKFGELDFKNLFTDPPKLDEAVGDSARRLEITCRDRWKSFELYVFREKLPFDGLPLDDAFLKLARTMGVHASSVVVEDSGLTLPIGGGSVGDWNVLADVGDRGDEWLSRFKENYAGTWFLGMQPTVTGEELWFRSPDDLGELSSMTLYLDRTDADTEEPTLTADERTLLLINKFHEATVDPEANDLFVVGMNPRTRLPIVLHNADAPAKDPTLSPSLRPDNWVGESLGYSWVNPYLTTEAICQNCLDLLYQRLTPRRFMAEWDSDLLIDPNTDFPVWKGDVVTIFGRGDYRITTLSVEISREIADDISQIHRRCHYTAEKIVDGTAKGCGHSNAGTTLDAIISSALQRMGLGILQPEKQSPQPAIATSV